MPSTMAQVLQIQAVDRLTMASHFALPSATSALPDEWDRNGNNPTPLYGEASVDGGQEVRFSVEITKIKNLPGLYSLDIRRMKGNLWAYKFLYHALLERSQLASTSN